MSEASRGDYAPGIAAGLLWSLPVAVCSGLLGGGALARPFGAGVLLWAAASLVVVPVGLWIRGASLKDPASVDRALWLGAALSSLPLALFAGVLKSTTHHRPLGGATFAVVALVVVVFCCGLALRVGRAATGRIAWLSHFFLLACLGSLGGALLLGLSGARVTLDFLTLAGACAGAGLVKIPTKVARLPALLTGVLWASVLLGGLLLTRDPGLMREASRRAPVSFAPFSWLGDGS